MSSITLVVIFSFISYLWLYEVPDDQLEEEKAQACFKDESLCAKVQMNCCFFIVPFLESSEMSCRNEILPGAELWAVPLIIHFLWREKCPDVGICGQFSLCTGSMVWLNNTCSPTTWLKSQLPWCINCE